MSETTREHFDNFWELLDELRNAVPFVLIGLEVLVLSFQRSYLLAGLVAIPLVLAARWLSVFLQVKAFSFVREFSEHDLDLGRTPRRYLCRAGALAAFRDNARCRGDDYLYRGGLLDSRTGAHHQSSARDGRGSPGQAYPRLTKPRAYPGDLG